MTATNYAYWRQELKTPGQSRDTADTPTNGFYRAKAAKTKPDYPVAIWHTTDVDEVEIIKIGNKQIDGKSAEGNDFRDGTWQHCEAVTNEVYDAAMETGFWPDGKNARKMSDEERMGIDISAGDNAAPIEESLAEQIESAVAKASAITSVKTEAEAKAANELADKLQTLFKLGEAERVKEKTPHDEAAKAVQAKWLPIINPASDARERLVGKGGLVKQWLKVEQDKIDAAARAERQRLAEEAERIRLENEKRAAEAAEAGEPEPAPVMPEISAPAVETQRATAGSTFGRSSGLRKVTVVDTIDVAVLTKHFIDSADEDFSTYLNTRAAKAVRAKVKLPGVTTKDQMQ